MTGISPTFTTRPPLKREAQAKAIKMIEEITGDEVLGAALRKSVLSDGRVGEIARALVDLGIIAASRSQAVTNDLQKAAPLIPKELQLKYNEWLANKSTQDNPVTAVNHDQAAPAKEELAAEVTLPPIPEAPHYSDEARIHRLAFIGAAAMAAQTSGTSLSLPRDVTEALFLIFKSSGVKNQDGSQVSDEDLRKFVTESKYWENQKEVLEFIADL